MKARRPATTGSVSHPLAASMTTDQTMELNLEDDADAAAVNATYQVEVTAASVHGAAVDKHAARSSATSKCPRAVPGTA